MIISSSGYCSDSTPNQTPSARTLSSTRKIGGHYEEEVGKSGSSLFSELFREKMKRLDLMVNDL